MGKGHSGGMIEHENEAYEEALKYVKEDVVMQAIMTVFSEKVTEKLNDTLFTWDSNQIRLNKVERNQYWIGIIALSAFIGVIILFILYGNL